MWTIRKLAQALFLWMGCLYCPSSSVGEELPFPPPRRPTLKTLEEIRALPTTVRSTVETSSSDDLVIERYPNRAVKLQRQVVQDAQRNYINHGAWTMLDPQGRVLAQGDYRHGKQHGAWMRMMPEFVVHDAEFRGPFLSQAEFDEGELHGTWTIIDARQRVVGSWQFSRGLLDGTSTIWYPNGHQRQEMSFARGVPDGEATFWKADGAILGKEFYREGKQLVPVVTWHDRQQRESEGWMVRTNFVIRAEVSWWDGKLAIVREATQGDEYKTGKWTEWYANGNVRFEGTFDGGQPTDQHAWWHPNGQKMLAGDYRSGLAEGLWTEWHANGQKQVEGRYLAGLKAGTWTTWNAEGLVADIQQMDSQTQIANTVKEDSISHPVSLLKPANEADGS